ncbi:MAG: carboxypeptidase regulatory-like domain-containing protein [Planctomycetes bacterium]|nr:carboxypeptidase regulatory-like domain-containing protein [Planctomycetota bacterium]
MNWRRALSLSLLALGIGFIAWLVWPRPGAPRPPSSPPTAQKTATLAPRSIAVDPEHGSPPTRPLDPPTMTGPAISGRIVDPTGAPIRDAEVVRLASAFGESKEILATTGDDGAFRVEIAEAKPVSLMFQAAGFVGERRQDLLPDARLLVVLEPGTIIRGRVIDATTEKPIVAAKIRIRHHSNPDVEERRVTDATGAFSFAIAHSLNELSVTAEGYVTCALSQVAPPANGETLIVRMPPDGASLLGYFRVIDDESGAPLPAATLAHVSADSLGDGIFRGHYQVSFDKRLVFVGAAGHVERHVDFSPPIGDSAENALEVRLANAAEIRGKVVDGKGAPVAGASVRLWLSRAAAVEYSTFPPTGAVVSDEAGAFAIGGLLPGSTFQVFVQHLQFVPAQIDGVAPKEAGPMEIAPIVLQQGTRLEGVVRTDEDGAALAGARVTLVAAECRSQAITDGDGQFGFDHAADSATLEVSAPDRVARRLTSIRSGDSPVEIRLAVGLVIAGVALESSGRAASGVSVTAKLRKRPDADPFALELLNRGVTNFTDEEGRFRIGGLLGGPYGLTATRGATALRIDGIEPGGDVEAGRVDLVLRLLTGVEQSATGIKGHVVDARDGRPLSQFSYHLRQGPVDGASGASMTNGAGEFFVRLLPDSSYTIDVTAPGHSRIVRSGIRVAEGEQHDEEFALSEQTFVEGVLVSEHGVPVAFATIRLDGTVTTGRGAQGPSAQTDERGRFRIQDLGSGPHRFVTLWSRADPWGGSSEIPVDVAPDSLDLRIGEERSVRLTMREPIGVAVEGSVAMSSDDEEPWKLDIILFPVQGSGATRRYEHTTKIRESRFRFPYVEPGTYQVYVQVMIEFGGIIGYDADPKQLVVPGTGDVHIALRLPARESKH